MYPLPLNGVPLPNGKNGGVSRTMPLCLMSWTDSDPVLGDVISVTVLGHRTIILNSFDAAVDLLEKKSAIYSDRPVQPMAGDLMHWSRQIVLSQYGDHFRNMRKLLYKYLGGRGQLEKIAPYHALIESETRRLLLRVIQDPTHLHKNVHR